jgi:4-hydroxy-tetrahydrodipicolinate synthase
MSSPASLPTGLYPVMLTPFHDDGAMDWRGLDALIEWYIENGAAGLFAVCLSSEMYDLSDEERLALAARVVQRAAGRASVVATGTFGGPLVAQAAFVRRMAETGVDAVVVIACQLVAADEDDAVLRDRLFHLLDATGEIPLGLYECPVPYHRLLSPALMRWAGQTGRFLYHKDTSCEPEAIRAKTEAVSGTPLGFFNAHTPTALMSLEAGAAGLSPIGANYYPYLYARLIREWRADPDAARDLQRRLSVMEGVASTKYPAAAKRYLAALGLPIGPRCRLPMPQFVYHDDALLAAVREMAGGRG